MRSIHDNESDQSGAVMWLFHGKTRHDVDDDVVVVLPANPHSRPIKPILPCVAHDDECRCARHQWPAGRSVAEPSGGTKHGRAKSEIIEPIRTDKRDNTEQIVITTVVLNRS